MLKIRKEIDLEVLKEQYGFKTKRSEDQVFLIFCDDEGNELEKYGTIVSFGLTKATYILEHFEEIKKFVEEQSKDKD